MSNRKVISRDDWVSVLSDLIPMLAEARERFCKNTIRRLEATGTVVTRQIDGDAALQIMAYQTGIIGELAAKYIKPEDGSDFMGLFGQFLFGPEFDKGVDTFEHYYLSETGSPATKFLGDIAQHIRGSDGVDIADVMVLGPEDVLLTWNTQICTLECFGDSEMAGQLRAYAKKKMQSGALG